jgi:hypothetical protein
MKRQLGEFGVYEDEKRFIECAAREVGVTISDYVRFCLLTAMSAHLAVREDRRLAGEFQKRAKSILAASEGLKRRM